MTIAVYPGSFDPVTYGHLDVIRRSSMMFDRLIIAVLKNSSKNPLFSVEERVKMLNDVVKDYPNVSVDSFDGLLVDFAHRQNAHVIVRGLRAVSDFEYELQMAQVNRTMASDIDTIFLATSLEYAYLSSSVVKETAQYHGDLTHFVPTEVEERLHDKFPDSDQVITG